MKAYSFYVRKTLGDVRYLHSCVNYVANGYVYVVRTHKLQEIDDLESSRPNVHLCKGGVVAERNALSRGNELLLDTLEPARLEERVGSGDVEAAGVGVALDVTGETQELLVLGFCLIEVHWPFVSHHLVESRAQILELGEDGRRSERAPGLVLFERIGNGVDEAGHLFDAVVQELPVVVDGDEALNVQVVHVEFGVPFGDVVGYHFSNTAGRTDSVRPHGRGHEVVSNLHNNTCQSACN